MLITGGKRLAGRVKVGGAKNSALKLMAASLLTDEPTRLMNVPGIADVFVMSQVLERLGAEVVHTPPDELVIKPDGPIRDEASYELVSQMRASIIVLGPLLARLGRARVAMPGGCNIGSRKIDLHILGLEALGAEVEVGHGFIDARARELQGTTISLLWPSVGATENLMMAATLARGRTVIENAAREPEVMDLATFLRAMGASIDGDGTPAIEIEGVRELHGVSYRVIPDRVEAGTFLMAGAMTGGDVTVEGCRPDHLGLVCDKLAEIGCHIRTGPARVRVACTEALRAVDIATLPYPGFPTDLQAPVMALLARADGTSIITENVFDSRFIVADELARMGADIRTEGRHAIIRGVSRLTGAQVRAPDLRGGAAVILAALAAEGVSEVRDLHHVDRGYQALETKLRGLGAEVERVVEGETSEVAAGGSTFKPQLIPG